MKTIKVSLLFPAAATDRPIISELVRGHDLTVNVLQAEITAGKRGKSVVDMSGDEKNLDKALAFLKENGITVNLFTTDIFHNRDRCIDCGACTSVCPTNAVSIGHPDWELKFNPEKCIRCRHCVDACPMRAINIDVFQ